MEAGRIITLPSGSGPDWLPGDQRIAFRVPAAAVSMIDVKDGRMGGQRLGFELWSETLDPVRADLAADRAGCRPGELSPCASAGPDGGRVGARYRSGEYLLRVMVANAVGVPGRSERVLRRQSGINPVPQPGWRPIVKCGAYVTAADDAPSRPCQMLGYFGAWPLILWVISDRAPEWTRPSSACATTWRGTRFSGRIDT